MGITIVSLPMGRNMGCEAFNTDLGGVGSSIVLLL